MRRSLYIVLLTFTLSAASFAALASADEGQQANQEKAFEDTQVKPTQTPQSTAVTEPTVSPAPVVKKSPKRWRLYGSVGYEYDDNVTLVSNKKIFRAPGDKSAGRYSMESGLAYDLYRSRKYRAEVSYLFGHDFHDDSLNEENLQEHILAVTGYRYLRLWNRPSRLSLRYRFVHNILGGDTFDSINDVTAGWIGEWHKNFVLSVYEQLGAKNFRDKGQFKPNTSRDGFYHRTGFIQRYLFDDRRREINAGYEIGFDATRGNQFDQIENGVRVGFITPVIEKIKFETNFYFQDGYYYHFPRTPRRHDERFNYEFILSRPLGKYLEIEGFYRRTDVDTHNKGINGQFNYDRNIYGFRLNFNY